MALMRVDESYSLAKTCHPLIVKFLEGIRTESVEFRKYCNSVKLNQYCRSVRGDVFRVECSWRNFTTQNELYKKVPAVTYAKGGESFHNWGLAVDIIFTRTGYAEAFYDQKTYPYKDLASFYEATGIVNYALSLGLRWLGRHPTLKDVAHFECYSLPAGDKKYVEENAVSGWWENKHGGGGGTYGAPPVTAESPEPAATGSRAVDSSRELKFSTKLLLAVLGIGVLYKVLNKR